jgi:hypothetical protein
MSLHQRDNRHSRLRRTALLVGALALTLAAVGGGTALATTSPPPVIGGILTNETTGVQDVSVDVTVSPAVCATIKAQFQSTDCGVSVGLEVQPLGGTQVGMEDGATVATPFRVYHEHATTCWLGHVHFGNPSGTLCALAHIDIDATYKHWYNSPRTWISSMTRPCPWGTTRGFSVSQTWCGWTNNGTSVMTTGVNFNYSDPTGAQNGWARIKNEPCGGWCVLETVHGS